MLFLGIDQHREVLIKLGIYGYDRENDFMGLRFHEWKGSTR